MKRFFIAFILLLATCKLPAQETDFAPAFEVKPDTAAYIEIPYKHWQYIEESEPVSFKRVSAAAYSKNFRQGKALTNNISSYWMRYSIKNPLKTPLRFIIHMYKEGHVYFVRNGRTEHYVSGYLVPKSQRDGLDKVLGIEYSLPPGEVVAVYLHDPQYDYKGLYPSIGIWDKVVQAYYIDYEEPSNDNSIFLGGFIFLAGLFNLLFYYIVKERVYLVYALTLVVIALACAYSVFFSYLLDEMPLTGKMVMYVIYMTGMLLVLTVMAMFLRVDHYYPRLFRLFIAVSSIGAVMGFMAYTKDIFNFWDNITLAANLTCAVPAGFLIVTAIVQVFKKRKQAYLFSLAVFPLTLCMFIALVLPDTPQWFNYCQQGCAAWGIAVISWSLFQRFRKIMNDNVQQALDNERLAREKEEERNALIAQQNEILEQQVEERTAALQQSLAELKQTQNQLIQNEKMASLGELTAGIAHEIQNPLNFVNNFSDVSVELLDELQEEMGKGDIEEANAIAIDIRDNLTKIAHHGRRADGIVKGMLQHSRTSTGQKELTDINALADEYLRLSYHGLRAKDKSFNVEMVTHFDAGLPKINVIPQDMGRVLLNLFNNAFYATQERSRQVADSSYKPTVEVSTQLKGNVVEIVVKDNGTGIPDSVKDKILQPFFTTKPTGQGTGLGLSLSYDIVVKAHGGTIEIESTEGRGAAFKINLPLNA